MESDLCILHCKNGRLWGGGDMNGKSCELPCSTIGGSALQLSYIQKLK